MPEIPEGWPEAQRLMQARQDMFDDEAENFTDELIIGGLLALWLLSFKDALKLLLIEMAIIGAGGADVLDSSDLSKLNIYVQTQYGYAAGFAQDIYDNAEDGKVSRAAILARLALYGGIAWGIGNRMFVKHRGHPNDLMVWTLFKTNSCVDCIAREGMVVRRADITFVPRDGSTRCGGFCGCEWLLYEKA